MSIQPYIQKCKDKAKIYYDTNIIKAWKVFSEEMEKQEETRNNLTFILAKDIVLKGRIQSELELKNIINGVN